MTTRNRHGKSAIKNTIQPFQLCHVPSKAFHPGVSSLTTSCASGTRVPVGLEKKFPNKQTKNKSKQASKQTNKTLHKNEPGAYCCFVQCCVSQSTCDAACCLARFAGFCCCAMRFMCLLVRLQMYKKHKQRKPNQTKTNTKKTLGCMSLSLFVKNGLSAESSLYE